MTTQPNWKVRTWRSKRYLDYVRFLPCCLCRAPGPNDPHHYQREGEGVMGGKVGDEYVVPLCHFHHMMLHEHGRVKWKDWGKDPEQVIAETQDKYPHGREWEGR